VSHPLKNIFAPRITRLGDSSCTFFRSIVSHGQSRSSRGSAKLLEQPLNFLPQGVRVLPVLLSEIPFELDMDKKLQIRAGEQPFSLAAAEKMPQEDRLFDGFGNSKDNCGFDDRVVAFCIAGSAGLALRPLEHAAFRHAGNGKGEMGIPRQ
jgi:hypothetical protein